MTDPKPISWRSIVYGTTVISSDGETAGRVKEVLGSDNGDIFHGLRVTLAGTKRDVMVPADDITTMSATEVRVELSRTQLQALPGYDEAATYHVSSVGWLRKHLGWKQDSKSDEEPG